MQMIVFAIVAAVVTTLGLHQCVNAQGCHKKTWSDPSTVNRILTPLPHETAMTVPDALDWRNINGTNWCTSSRNQHIPQYCGSCWAMASTSALSDRIRIARHAAFPDFMIAPQTLVHCTCDGCHGGNAEIAYLWIYLNGIGTEPCQNYIAQGIGRECTAEAKCMNCSPDGNCSAVTQYPKFYLKEFGQVLGVEHMKAEIAARGPIACYVNAGPIYLWGFANAGPDLPVFTSLEGRNSTDHVISVVGYGYDSKQGIPYWVIRNSWGEYWGDNGYFRLESGKNLLNMEHTACAWAVPKIPSNV